MTKIRISSHFRAYSKRYYSENSKKVHKKQSDFGTHRGRGGPFCNDSLRCDAMRLSFWHFDGYGAFCKRGHDEGNDFGGSAMFIEGASYEKEWDSVVCFFHVDS